MLLEALAFLVRNLASFFILNLLLRFYLQVVRAPFGHPLAQFTVKLTNFIVMPVRRVIPSIAGYDTATLLLAWLGSVLMHLLLLALTPVPFDLTNPSTGLGLLALGLLELMKLSLYLLFAAVLVQAILSWVNPYNPLAPLLDKLSRPYLTPIRKLIPNLGGVDLSTLVLLLILQMVLMFALAPLEQRVLLFTLLG